jgi:hypothetical protein
MDKNQDPGSCIQIPDLQHWLQPKFPAGKQRDGMSLPAIQRE